MRLKRHFHGHKRVVEEVSQQRARSRSRVCSVCVVPAFFHKCVTCAGMFVLAAACVSIPKERRRTATVNTPSAPTSPAPPRTSICLAHLVPSITRGSSPFALRVLSHTSSRCLQHSSSLFPPLSLSFPPVYLTPPPSPFPLSLWLSFTASVAFPACPLLHPLSSPHPYVACLFNLI